MKASPLLAFLGISSLTLIIVLEELAPTEFSVLALSMVIGIASTCIAVSLWLSRPADEWRYVCLGSVFCLYYGVSYGFAAFGTPPQFSQRVLPGGLDSVNLVSLPVGILAWLAGYHLLHLRAVTAGARHLVLPPKTLSPVGPSTLVVLYATTVVVRLWQIASGTGYGYLRDAVESTTSTSSLAQYLDVYGQLGIVILGVAIVASGYVSSGADGYRRAYLWIIPFEAALRLLAGDKSGPLLLVAVIVFGLMATGKLSFSPRKLAMIGLVAVLVLFPLIGAYRDVLRPEQGRQLSPGEAPAAAVTAIKQTASAFAEGPVAYSQFSFDQTGGRLREIDRAAVSIQAHDAGKPYSPPGEMVQRVQIGLVPRLLWPDKPLNLYALDVSRNYYRLSTNVISASSLSPIGDAYRYGGLVMVVVALAVVGAFVRFLDEMLAPRHSVWLVPLIIATIPLIRGGDIAGLLVGAVRYFLVAGIFYRFLFVRTLRASGGYGRSSGTASDAPVRGRPS